MRNGRGQFDVAHTLTAYRGAGHGDAAAIAGHALELYSLIFAAGAFPVSDGPEDSLAEKAVLFRFEGPVVQCFRFFHGAIGPRADRLGRGYLNSDMITIFQMFWFTSVCHSPYSCLVSSFLNLSPFSDFSPLPCPFAWPSLALTSLISRHRPCNSFTKTLNDSGVPGVKRCCPLTIASY